MSTKLCYVLGLVTKKNTRQKDNQHCCDRNFHPPCLVVDIAAELVERGALPVGEGNHLGGLVVGNVELFGTVAQQAPVQLPLIPLTS